MNLKRLFLLIGFAFALSLGLNCAAETQDFFQQGKAAYTAGNYGKSAGAFREAASAAPSVETLHNLGNAEWQSGNAGPAVLAWERAQWLDPFNPRPVNNLRYARKAAELDSPELSWYELCSTWLPVDAWPWIAAFSFWYAVSMVLLPGIFSWRKAGWHQAVATTCFAVFLLTIPALYGVHSRAKLGVILPKDTPLRLTPTADAQIITKLPAGETARFERARGNYVFIRNATASGWVEQAQFALIAGNSQPAPAQP